MVSQNSTKVLSLILLSALLVLVVSLWVQSYSSHQKENMELTTTQTPPTLPPEPSSGIARCKYGGYTPILTCSYQAFRQS